jgi:hypothetical protein
MKKTIGLGLKGNGIRKANPPVVYYFRVQTILAGFEAVSTGGRDEPAGMTIWRKATRPPQESAASFGADSTSVNLVEGTPAFSRPSR